MSILHTWHTAVPVSLAEFADLVTDPKDITPALAAVAVLWPLREPIQAYDGDAADALQTVIGDVTGKLLKIISSWSEDRLLIVRQVHQLVTHDPELQAAFMRLIKTFNATAILTERLVSRLSPPGGRYRVLLSQNESSM